MTDAKDEMIFAAPRAPSPAGMLWLFVRSLAASALVASALYAALYVAQDMRARDASVAAPPAAPNAVSAGPGLELLTPFADAHALAAAVGFQPVLPAGLPAGVAAPKFDATQPDASGARRAEIRYAAPRDAAGHAAGPSLLLVEARAASAGGTGAPAHDPASGRYTAVVACGPITVAAALFFPASTPEPDAGAQAASFFAALGAQCR